MHEDALMKLKSQKNCFSGFYGHINGTKEAFSLNLRQISLKL